MKKKNLSLQYREINCVNKETSQQLSSMKKKKSRKTLFNYYNTDERL